MRGQVDTLARAIEVGRPLRATLYMEPGKKRPRPLGNSKEGSAVAERTPIRRVFAKADSAVTGLLC